MGVFDHPPVSIPAADAAPLPPSAAGTAPPNIPLSGRRQRRWSLPDGRIFAKGHVRAGMVSIDHDFDLPLASSTTFVSLAITSLRRLTTNSSLTPLSRSNRR